MMINNIKKPFLIAFLASTILTTQSHSSLPNQGVSAADLGKIRLRTGIGTALDNEEIQRQRDEKYRRDAFRTVAEAAQDKAAVAQHVFAFKHNFLLPKWLRNTLPDEVSSNLLQMNLHGAHLSLEGTLNNKRRLTTALLRINGLGEDLLAATMTPESRFIRLINEVGFDQDADPFSLAKNFGALAMRLDNYRDLGINEETADHMMGALYYAASQEISSVFSALSDEAIKATFAPEALVDFYTSAGQLRRWAANRTQDHGKQLKYTVEALRFFEKARTHAGKNVAAGAFTEKIMEEQHLAYDFFESWMILHGRPAASVKNFISARRARI